MDGMDIGRIASRIVAEALRPCEECGAMDCVGPDGQRCRVSNPPDEMPPGRHIVPNPRGASRLVVARQRRRTRPGAVDGAGNVNPSLDRHGADGNAKRAAEILDLGGPGTRCPACCLPGGGRCPKCEGSVHDQADAIPEPHDGQDYSVPKGEPGV